MDASCILLTCLLLIQMAMVLVMLNPIYDIRKLTRYITDTLKVYKTLCVMIFSFYFTTVLYLGMYIPLRNVVLLIFENTCSEYEKLMILSRIEKNYIVAGFSLFLVVVIYGVKSLVSYTACLMELADRQNEAYPAPSQLRFGKTAFSAGNILPHILKVRRSISYETIMFTKELRDQLSDMVKNVEIVNNGCPLANIVENNGVNVEKQNYK